jgi:hypothetical protein
MNGFVARTSLCFFVVHISTWRCFLRMCVVFTGDASRFVVARAVARASRRFFTLKKKNVTR